ncbi:MAG: GNAT family N-acetyltransferase [Actinobacteria bacterium]|nr:GNAT family N-acetyltransferase [Actinomycetota bacterium]
MTEPPLAWLPPVPLSAYGRQPVDTLPFPLAEPSARHFLRPRQALWQGLAALALADGDELLMPAYHHGSEVEAAAANGLVPSFYEGTDALEPDEAELETLVGPRTRGLYLIHNLGFPQDAARWRRWCDERGLLLIEDLALGWLATVGDRPAGSFGDLAVFGYYTMLGLPEGAAVLRPGGPAALGDPVALQAGWNEVAKKQVARLAMRLPLLSALRERMREEREYVPEEDFDLGDRESQPTAADFHLLPRLATAEVREERRANYQALLQRLSDLVPGPFTELTPGACPLVFPVDSDGRTELLARLAQNGIAALNIWSVPHPLLPEHDFPRAAERRARTIGLPVHQELRPRDLDRLVRVVRGSESVRRPVRLESAASLEGMRDNWNRLAERSGNVFASWEWSMTWYRHFGEGKPLLVTTCRDRDGRLAVILPLYLWSSRPLRIVRFLGHGPGDQLGPICASEDRSFASRCLRRTLSESPWNWDVFLGEELPGDEGWSSLLGATTLRRGKSPVVDLEGRSWETYLAAKSSNFRQQVRRRERRLAREHDLRYRLADDPARLSADLDTLFALHAERWPGEGSDFGGRREPFHREFATAALERGWLRLWFLELDGQPAAAWYGFRFAGVESYYQAGRGARWDDASVGFVLLAHSLREAAADGVREYRLLRGGESFKYRFADGDTELETLGLSRGVLGVTALSGISASGRSPLVRRALRPVLKASDLT